MLFVDVETTGLNPSTDYILSMGAIDFFHPKNQFYDECGIPDFYKPHAKALEINGFKEEDLKNGKKQSSKDLLVKFINWCAEHKLNILAGHNVSFDKEFIDKGMHYSLVDKKVDFDYRTVDLHSVCFTEFFRRTGITKTFSLDNILEYVGLPKEPHPHNALTGAKLEAEAYARFVRKISLLDEYKQYPIPKYLFW